MITSIYGAVLTIFICFLSLRVIRLRRIHKVRHGDGGVHELELARAAQANTVDYCPMFLLMLFFLESRGLPHSLIHGLGIIFFAARVLHYRSIVKEHLKGRILAMRATFTVMILVSILNLIAVLFQLT